MRSSTCTALRRPPAVGAAFVEEVRRAGAAHKIVGDSIRATTALNTTAATATIGINFLIEPIPEMRKLIAGPAIAAIDTPKIANPRIVARDELFRRYRLGNICVLLRTLKRRIGYSGTLLTLLIELQRWTNCLRPLRRLRARRGEFRDRARDFVRLCGRRASVGSGGQPIPSSLPGSVRTEERRTPRNRRETPAAASSLPACRSCSRRRPARPRRCTR